MATRKSRTPPDTAADLEASASLVEGGPEPPVVETAAQRQLAELAELTRSLLLAVQAVNAQQARNEALQNSVNEVTADVKAATRAMLLAPPGKAATEVVRPAPHEGRCGPCECVSESCCCFDIILSKVRAAKPQIEPPDMGDVPPLINAMEIQFYVTVFGIGFLFPGIGSTFDLRADGLPGGPGPWVTIERVINRVCLKRGTSMTIPVLAEAREHDEGVERPIAFKDEIGEGSALITLDCCADTIYPPGPIEVYLMHGGEGRGMIELAFYAKRVCC